MIRRALPWLVALAVAGGLLAWSLAHFYPPLPNPLAIELELPAGRAGQSEPLVAAGRFGEADFLFVRWLDAQTIAIGYDSWGGGGPVSAPIKLAATRTRHRVEIQMPALGQMISRLRFASGSRVRVTFDGSVALDVDAQHYLRDPDAIWLGENPIGGSSCGARFSGKVFRAGAATEWRGGAKALFPWRERLAAWRAHCAWPIVAALAMGAAIVFAGTLRWHAETRRRGDMGNRGPASVFGPHGWFIGAALVSVACCGWIVTGGTWKFIFPEGFGSFFDFQAANLLQGRLDVPPEGIGDEAFVFAGKYFGYFGVTPAVLRLPFVIFDAGFGKLSRSFMLAEFAACGVASYLLLLAATEFARGPGARPRRSTTLLFTASASLGSTLFFLGSRAYIYHEAILCGAAFALLATWCALRHLLAPDGRWWIGALACGVASVHARPPMGLFALTLLACVAGALAWRARKITRRHVTLAALSFAGVLSFNGLSYLKFRTFEGAPLRLNVQYGSSRLAHIEGKNFHLSNLRFNTHTYLGWPSLRFDAHCPWVSLDISKPRRDFPEAKNDFNERTLALPFAMPPLFVLATAGGALAWLALPAARPALGATWLAIGPMALAMFTAVATAHRYTADFCPFLIAAAAFGFVALEAVAPRWRAAAHATLAVATLWAIFITAALTFRYQGEIVRGVPDEVRENYRALCERVDRLLGN